MPELMPQKTRAGAGGAAHDGGEDAVPAAVGVLAGSVAPRRGTTPVSGMSGKSLGIPLGQIYPGRGWPT